MEKDFQNYFKMKMREYMSKDKVEPKKKERKPKENINYTYSYLPAHNMMIESWPRGKDGIIRSQMKLQEFVAIFTRIKDYITTDGSLRNLSLAMREKSISSNRGNRAASISDPRKPPPSTISRCARSAARPRRRRPISRRR